MIGPWEETARRLVAHERWDWPGRIDYIGRRPVDDRPWHEGCYPDLTDDATAGVLLGMLAETQCAEGDRPMALDRVWRLVNAQLRYAAHDHLGHAAALALLDVWGGP